PDKFMQPEASDLRYNWVLVRLTAIDEREMRELVLDAWRMGVPKSVAAAYVEYGRIAEIKGTLVSLREATGADVPALAAIRAKPEVFHWWRGDDDMEK